MLKPNKTNKETITFLKGCEEVNKFLFYWHVNVDVVLITLYLIY